MQRGPTHPENAGERNVRVCIVVVIGGALSLLLLPYSDQLQHYEGSEL